MSSSQQSMVDLNAIRCHHLGFGHDLLAYFTDACACILTLLMPWETGCGSA